MTSVPEPSYQQPGPVAPVPPNPPVRARLTRSRSEAWLGGVAAGIADHLGWPTWLVRLCFVGLAFANFLTIGVYAVLWILMPEPSPVEQPPGLREGPLGPVVLAYVRDPDGHKLCAIHRPEKA